MIGTTGCLSNRGYFVLFCCGCSAVAVLLNELSLNLQTEFAEQAFADYQVKLLLFNR
jgi:uncharacterized metal-binding protein